MEATIISLAGLTGKNVCFEYAGKARTGRVELVRETQAKKLVLVCQTPEGFKSFSQEKISSLSID